MDDLQNDDPKKDGINKQKNGNGVVLGLFDVEPESKPKPKPVLHKVKQSGNDAVLDIFSSESIEAVAPKKKKEFEKEKEEERQHQGKQQEDDPFAVSVSSPPKHNDDNKKNKKDNADTVPVDYSKLTQIADVDQYKIVSVEEKVIIDDGDGNIKQQIDQKINDDNAETNDNMQNPSDNDIPVGDLSTFLNDTTLLRIFLQFLKKKTDDFKLLEFYLMAGQFKTYGQDPKSTRSAQTNNAKLIIETFLLPDSKKFLETIQGMTRHEAISQFLNGGKTSDLDLTLFDRARQEVKSELISRVFPIFIKSDRYKKLIYEGKITSSIMTQSADKKNNNDY